MPMGFTLPGVGQPAAPGAADPDAPKPVGDPPVAPADRAAVIEALRLADLWLDPESALPSGIRSTAAWSRGEWLNATLDIWRKMCDPVAERMVSAMTELVPEEMRSQMGPMTSMVASLGGAPVSGCVSAGGCPAPTTLVPRRVMRSVSRSKKVTGRRGRQRGRARAGSRRARRR
jgi:hypothetical protein